MKHAPPPPVTVDAGDLAAALRNLMRVTPRRATAPILSAVRLSTFGDLLHVQATDLDLWLTHRIRCATAAPLSVVVTPAPLLALARAAEPGATLTLAMQGDVLVATCGAATLRQRVIFSALDWPESKAQDCDIPTAQIAQGALHRMVDRLLPFVSRDSTRYYLNGICLQVRDGRLRGVSTDGHRLGFCTTDIGWEAPETILPHDAARALREASRGAPDTPVRLGATASWLVADGDNWSFCAKCIDGTFPDCDTMFSRSTGWLADAVKTGSGAAIDTTLAPSALRAFPPSRDLAPALCIDPDAGQMWSTCAGLDVELAVPVTGSGGAFTVNLRYVQQILRAFRGPVRLRSDAPENPFLVQGEDPDLTLLLMPMRNLAGPRLGPSQMTERTAP